tara:strand:- start:227 stop:337 length:111 start_codon:yes stop_codon:yes gene_type:complete
MKKSHPEWQKYIANVILGANMSSRMAFGHSGFKKDL